MVLRFGSLMGAEQGGPFAEADWFGGTCDASWGGGQESSEGISEQQVEQNLRSLSTVVPLVWPPW